MICYDEAGKEIYKMTPYLSLNDIAQDFLHMWLNFHEQKNKFKYEISKLENEIAGLKKEIVSLKSENEKLVNWIMSMCED